MTLSHQLSEIRIMAAKERYAEPTYLECGFGELEHKVISPEICCRCGTCEALCPRIEHKVNRPELVDYDPLCGLCYAYCPRTFLDMGEIEAKIFGRSRSQDEALGIFKKAVCCPGAVQDRQRPGRRGGDRAAGGCSADGNDRLRHRDRPRRGMEDHCLS